MRIFEFLENIKILINKKYDLVFYSESKNYSKLFNLAIKDLSKVNNLKILYASSDKEDKLLFTNVDKIYIGKNFILSILFNLIQAKILITTTTDLGNNLLKKNNKKENYIYFFHSPVSTHKFYTKSAFDNYDYIFCNGDYQLIELQKLENINNSKNKVYKKIGYLYFDYLDKFKNEKKDNQVLIAPSWNSRKKNFTSLNCLKLLQNLLDNTEYKIVFRPHPEQLKRDYETIQLIKKKFNNTENFYLDLSDDNTNFMKSSDILISDYSGIALEFIMIFQRPVIFINDVPKIHNNDFEKVDRVTIEDDIRAKFGYQIKPDDISLIHNHIQYAIDDFNLKKYSIDKFLRSNFYNFGNSNKYFCKEILNILKK